MARVADEVTAVTNHHGGFVLSSSVSTGEDGAGGDFDLRIPSARLRTDYSVVTVSLLAKEGDSGGTRGGSFDDALGDAGDLLVTVAGWVVRALAVALPLGVLALAGWAAGRVLRRAGASRPWPESRGGASAAPSLSWCLWRESPPRTSRTPPARGRTRPGRLTPACAGGSAIRSSGAWR